MHEWEFTIYAGDGHRLYKAAAAELDLPPWHAVQTFALDSNSYPGVHIVVVPDGRAACVARQDGLWMAGVGYNGGGFLAVQYLLPWPVMADRLASIVARLPWGMYVKTRHRSPDGVREGHGYAAGLGEVLCLQAAGEWPDPF